MSDGRLFHARGPATANARSPMVERRVESTTRSAEQMTPSAGDDEQYWRQALPALSNIAAPLQ